MNYMAAKDMGYDEHHEINSKEYHVSKEMSYEKQYKDLKHEIYEQGYMERVIVIGQLTVKVYLKKLVYKILLGGYQCQL